MAGVGSGVMYRLVFDRRAVKELSRIDRPFQVNIKKKLQILARNPEALKNDIKKLKGGRPELFRLRIGSYRVIYQKKEDKLVILIIRVGHRKEVYE
jgi:mRNA interferase RelE/StbE